MALNDFEMPTGMVMDEATATPFYAKFVTEPWENGFGHTIGNALRRILMSMLDGVAVSCIRIDGVTHEFTNIPGVMEDVMEIILNIKKLKFRCEGELPRTLELVATKAGDVTGKDIKEDGVAEVINKDQKICTLTADCKSKPLRIEMDLASGRGYRPSERNRNPDQAVGSIPVDCLFNPVERVRYDVQASRVGEHTDYDRLELAVWTDGRIDPKSAVIRAAAILRDHLQVFLSPEGLAANLGRNGSLSANDLEIVNNLMKDVHDLELSCRSVNCLNANNIHTIGELIQHGEAEMLKYRNFGRKSLNEMKEKLADLGLALEMTLSNAIKEEVARQMAARL